MLEIMRILNELDEEYPGFRFEVYLISGPSGGVRLVTSEAANFYTHVISDEELEKIPAQTLIRHCATYSMNVLENKGTATHVH